MALNFTGRPPAEPPEQPPRRRAPVFLLSCLVLAAAMAALVFALALRPPPAPSRLQAPPSPLIGVSEPPPAAPTPSAPPPAPAPIAAPASAPAAVPSPTPAKPAAPTAAQVRARMLSVLKAAPHGAITLSVEDDAGAQAYARQLADLFREAGWTVSVSSVFGSGPPRRGLNAALGDTPADEAVKAAFAAVGYALGPPPAAGLVQTPELFVGAPGR